MKTPRADTKQYRTIVLPNGIQALLVSSDKTEKAAMSVNVQVGSYNDPDDLPGLAHFLEHMLFMGTKDYPEEDAYEKMLEENNGRYNAYTDAMRTVYFFDIQYDALKKILPLFSGFFTSPLLAASAVDREMNAVHSEHEKNLQSDGWRVSQLQAHLANSKHPYSKFGTGDRTTLDKPGIVDRLRQFYEAHYSANKMCLSIIGRESLDELEKLIRTYFANVPQSANPAPLLTPDDMPFTSNVNQVYNVVSVNDTREVDITWYLNNYSKDYRCNPSAYCGAVIGYEGKGSLFSTLKPMGCLSLSAGGGTENTNFSEFNVNFEVAPSTSAEVVKNMIDLTIGYVQLLAKSSVSDHENRYGLISRLSLRQFEFAGEPEPMNLVQKLSISLEKHEDEYLLANQPRQFDADVITKYLQELGEGSPLIFLISRDSQDNPLSEPVYGTKYKETSYNFEQKLVDGLKLRDSLNPFEPTNTDLLEVEVPESLIREKPVRLATDLNMELWFCQSSQFKRPKSHIILTLKNPEFSNTAKNYLTAYIFLQLFTDSLNEILYDSMEAGMNTRLMVVNDKLTIDFYGYSAGISPLINRILNELFAFNITKEAYQRILEEQATQCKIFKMSSPYHQLLYKLSEVTVDGIYSIDDLLLENKALTFEDLWKFKDNFAQLVSSSWFSLSVYGNETEENAKNYAKSISNQLKPLSGVVKFPSPKTIPLEIDTVISLENKDETNIAFGIQFALGNRASATPTDLKEYVSAILLSSVLSQPFFDSLRTKQQLGYIVSCRTRREYDEYGILFMAQAVEEKFPEVKIRTLFETFLRETAPAVLKGLSSEEYLNLQKSLINQIVEMPTSMNKSLSFMQNEIQNPIGGKEPDFEMYQKLANIVSEISQIELLTYYINEILGGKPVQIHTVVNKQQENSKPSLMLPVAIGTGLGLLSSVLN
tara:strand:- start:4244 stop:7045 length:2802 start_codon:yes stop_codon:yes gene_type:complete